MPGADETAMPNCNRYSGRSRRPCQKQFSGRSANPHTASSFLSTQWTAGNHNTLCVVRRTLYDSLLSPVHRLYRRTIGASTERHLSYPVSPIHFRRPCKNLAPGKWGAIKLGKKFFTARSYYHSSGAVLHHLMGYRISGGKNRLRIIRH